MKLLTKEGDYNDTPIDGKLFLESFFREEGLTATAGSPQGSALELARAWMMAGR